MRAVAGEVAFEQGEGVDLERVGDEGGVAIEEAGSLVRAAPFPAGEGDVRVERAALGLEADRLARPLDLCGERRDRRLGLDAGP